MSHWTPFFEKIKNELDARLTHSAVVVVKTSDANLIRMLTNEAELGIFEHATERPGWIGLVEHAALYLKSPEFVGYVKHVAAHRRLSARDLAESIPKGRKDCFFRASSDEDVLEQSAIFSQLVPQVKLIFFIANSELDLAVDPVNFDEAYFAALGSYLGTPPEKNSQSDFTEVVKRAILLGATCNTVDGDRALGALGAIPPNPKPEISFSLLDQSLFGLYKTADSLLSVVLEYEHENQNLRKNTKRLSDDALRLTAEAVAHNRPIQAFFSAFIVDWGFDSTPKNNVSHFRRAIKEIKQSIEMMQTAEPMPMQTYLSAALVRALLDNSGALLKQWRNHAITTLISCFQPELVGWARRHRLADDFYFACARISNMDEAVDSGSWYAAELMPDRLKAALQLADFRAWLRKFRGCWRLASPMVMSRPNLALDELSSKLGGQLRENVAAQILRHDFFEGKLVIGRTNLSFDQAAIALAESLNGTAQTPEVSNAGKSDENKDKIQVDSTADIRSQLLAVKVLIPFIRFHWQIEKTKLEQEQAQQLLYKESEKLKEIIQKRKQQKEKAQKDIEATQRTLAIDIASHRRLIMAAWGKVKEELQELGNWCNKPVSNDGTSPETKRSCLQKWPNILPQLDALSDLLGGLDRRDRELQQTHANQMVALKAATDEFKFDPSKLKDQKGLERLVKFLSDKSQENAYGAIGGICDSLYGSSGALPTKVLDVKAAKDVISQCLKKLYRRAELLKNGVLRLHAPDIEAVRLEVLIACKNYISADSANEQCAVRDNESVANNSEKEKANAEKPLAFEFESEFLRLSRLLEELADSQKREPLIPKERVELLRAEFEESNVNFEAAITIYERLRDAADSLLDPVLWRLSHYGALRCRMSARSLPEKAGYASLMCFADVQDLRSVQLDGYGHGGKRVVFPSFRGTARAGVQKLCARVRDEQPNQNAGLSLFVDFERSEESDFDPVIYDRLMHADVVIVFLSHDYFTSPWCKAELTLALQQNRFRGTELRYVFVDTEGNANSESIKEFLRSHFLGQVVSFATSDDQFFVKDRLERLLKYGLPLEPSRVSAKELADKLLEPVKKICAEKSRL